MTNYIYDSRGNPVGFWRGRYVYQLNGTPIGQLRDTHVHKLTGPYVGELHRQGTPAILATLATPVIGVR